MLIGDGVGSGGCELDGLELEVLGRSVGMRGDLNYVFRR